MTRDVTAFRVRNLSGNESSLRLRTSVLTMDRVEPSSPSSICNSAKARWPNGQIPSMAQMIDSRASDS